MKMEIKIDRQQMTVEYQNLRNNLQGTYDKALALGELYIAEQLANFLTTCESILSSYRKEDRAAQIEELKMKKAR